MLACIIVPSEKTDTRPGLACECWYAIVPSEKTDTLACNEFWLLMCLRAVREGPRDALACKELRVLRHRSADGKPTVTHQRWRTNLVTQPICIYCSMPLDCLSPQISGKRRDMLPQNMIPRAFSTIHWHNPTSDATAVAKKKKRDSNTSVELLPAASHVYLSIYLSINLSICLSIYHFSIHLSIELTISLSICLSVYLSIKFSLSLYIYICMYIYVYLFVCLSVYLSIYLSMSLPICLCTCLGI